MLLALFVCWLGEELLKKLIRSATLPCGLESVTIFRRIGSDGCAFDLPKVALEEAVSVVVSVRFLEGAVEGRTVVEGEGVFNWISSFGGTLVAVGFCRLDFWFPAGKALEPFVALAGALMAEVLGVVKFSDVLFATPRGGLLTSASIFFGDCSFDGLGSACFGSTCVGG